MTKCSAENLSLTALANNQLSGYGYDAAGNMISDPTDSVSATYDPENRISSASTPQGMFTYVYDADGNRIEKSGGDGGMLYWYMTPGIVAESDLAGNLKSEYVFFNGERVARRDFDASTGAATGVFYYFSDHLKTASVITDSAGNITAESDYYPWGGELQFVNNDSNHYKFTGKERDSESGLDYFGARYYSNGLGRFLTPDWAAKATAVPYAEFSDPQSLNLYTYVRNIPTSKVDADGHCPPCEQAIERVLEDPQAISEALEQAGKAMGAIGAGAAAGWATASGAVQKVWGFLEESGAQATLTDLPQPPGGVLSNLKSVLNSKSPTSGQQQGQQAKGATGLPKMPTGKGSVPPEKRDPKRTWTKREKRDQVVDKQNGKCPQCGKDLDPDQAVGHHWQQRHADGGPTNGGNLKCLHPECHPDLHGQGK